MKKNKDSIAKLREKNKRLRTELAKKKAVSLRRNNIIIPFMSVRILTEVLYIRIIIIIIIDIICITIIFNFLISIALSFHISPHNMSTEHNCVHLSGRWESNWWSIQRKRSSKALCNERHVWEGTTIWLMVFSLFTFLIYLKVLNLCCYLSIIGCHHQIGPTGLRSCEKAECFKTPEKHSWEKAGAAWDRIQSTGHWRWSSVKYRCWWISWGSGEEENIVIK